MAVRPFVAVSLAAGCSRGVATMVLSLFLDPTTIALERI
jgi:hypothetical protein